MVPLGIQIRTDDPRSQAGREDVCGGDVLRSEPHPPSEDRPVQGFEVQGGVRRGSDRGRDHPRPLRHPHRIRIHPRQDADLPRRDPGMPQRPYGSEVLRNGQKVQGHRIRIPSGTEDEERQAPSDRIRGIRRYAADGLRGVPMGARSASGRDRCREDIDLRMHAHRRIPVRYVQRVLQMVHRGRRDA